MKYLYHATPLNAVKNILEMGLLASYCGSIHGVCDFHPSQARIYLSTKPNSDNLHTNLFTQGEVVVLKIDADHLDLDNLYPDDFLLEEVVNGDALISVEEIVRETGLEPSHAKILFNELERCTDPLEIAEIMKPLAQWSLARHGEASYTRDIPPAALVAIRPYGAAPEEEVPLQNPAPANPSPK